MSPFPALLQSGLIILLFKPGFISTSPVEADVEGCKIEDEDARNLPWLGYLRISNSTDAETESDVYWPVVVIGSSTVLTGVRAFRSLYYDRKLNILNLDMYHVHLKGGVRRSVISIQLNPGFAARGEMCENWMKTEDGIALVHLNEPISFSREIRRLCLPTWSQEWWDKIQSNDESFLGPGNTSLISGWRGTYDNSLQKKDISLQLKLNTSEECRREWQTCWEYAEEEDLGDVLYVNRVCGMQFGSVVVHLQAEEEDHGLFAGYLYFSIQTGPDNDRILSGILDGISHLVNGRPRPTAFVLLLQPSRLKWINASMECGPDKYPCGNGECIDAAYVCNRTPDCDDGSDENHTFCRGFRHCLPSEYECGTYGECLDASKVNVCDGNPDCTEGDDEAGCPSLPIQTKLQHIWVSIVLALLAIVMFIGTVALVHYKMKMTKQKHYLTDEEIFQFRQGIRTAKGWLTADNPMHEFMRFCEASASGSDEKPQLGSMQMPFIYDLEKHQIMIGKEIGAGAFGVVYKGSVDDKTVAVKALKPELVDKEMFKTLLVELKIMAFVNFIKGGHENVIGLVGAYTQEIRNFELLVAIEYCKYGSIADYLKEHRSKFEDEFGFGLPPPPPYYVAASSLQAFGVHDLFKWAREIAEGMHFLASHKIIHGDLAARNVLLDSNLNAKISDFGLSRQIYYYNTSCAKICKNTLLPWRWMAPEVIESMKISSKSDVWSFGVTVWEIFSLGSVPYGGLEWNPHFVDQLRYGLRLPKSKYSDDTTFTVIQRCWEYKAEERPNFASVKDLLRQQDLRIQNPCLHDSEA